MFVLDVAHQHFEHVFHGQVAHDLAVGFFHHGEVRATLAELLEQLRQRHVPGNTFQRAGQLGEVERLRNMVQRCQFQQQVLDVQQADELATFSVIQRITAEFVTAEQGKDFLERRIEVQ